MTKKQKIVTLGGGTGSLQILTGLRDFHEADVATIMSMADDGGSTGRMREEFKMPAFAGDFRDALVGLAENEDLAKVFMHRFERGKELKGHSVGNIVLLGLFETTNGNIPKALEIAHRILRVRGKVVPSTTESVNLCCRYDNGKVLKSQHKIDNTDLMDGHRISKAWLEPKPKAYNLALKLIKEADKIIIGPGDLYSSVLANLMVEGIPEAIQKSKAKKIYISNLMTKYNQTQGMMSKDFVQEIEKYLGGKVDYVIVNNEPLPEDIMNKYKHEHWYMVEDNLDETSEYTIIRRKIWLEGKEFKRVSSDIVPRSFIRHDPKKIAKIIINL